MAAAANARGATSAHEAAHRAVGDRNALTVQLLPALLVAVATVEALVIDPLDLAVQDLVTPGPRAPGARLRAVVGAGGELQGSADRLDPPSSPAGVDVGNYLLV